MPKRSALDRLEHYEKKIRKLMQKKESVKRRRVRCLHSSDDENIADSANIAQNESEPETGLTNLPEREHSFEMGSQQSLTAVQDLSDQPIVPVQETLDQPSLPLQDTTPEATTEINLDPEILSALGASTADTPDFGRDIHDSLAGLWTPLLKKGLPKDQKDNLLKDKEYLIPGNCKMLQPPKLNAEISAAVSDVVRGRDKKFVGFQQQLGTGTSAINRAMDILLSSDNKIQALKHLSDGCRILTDLHYALTKDRIKLITPSLEKNFLHVIQDSERDDTLFGNSLSEKIRASKAIERQSSQIRKTVTTPRSATVQSSVSRSASQGKWTGPPRYPSNRGGRGGQSHRGQRPAAPPRRNYPPSTLTQARGYHQPRPRAPPQ